MGQAKTIGFAIHHSAFESPQIGNIGHRNIEQHDTSVLLTQNPLTFAKKSV